MTTTDFTHNAAGLRVLVLGVNFPGALMHSYEMAFRRLGADVETYCLSRAYANGLSATAVRIANRVAPTLLMRRFNAKLLADLSGRRIDIALVLKGERIAPRTIDALRAATGARWLNFYPDDPFSDLRWNRLAYGTETLGAYDHCFTFAQHLIPRYQSAGARRVSWLPFARDPDLHAPVPNVREPEYEIVFVGNIDGERVRWLESVAGSFKMGIFGEHTRAAVPGGSALRRAAFLPAAYGTELAAALARGAISLNVMRDQNRFSHNMRSFESLACGAFTLSQRTPELEAMFRENMEVAFADAPADLPARVEYWLPRAAERRRVAAAGFGRVRDDTYEERARTILATVALAAVAPER